MSGFSWPLPSPLTTLLVNPGGLVGTTNNLPTSQQPRRGTVSWLLVNLDGNIDMRPNEMDVIFVNGSVFEITTGVLVLDQRIRKSSAEIKGSNQFAPGWGSIITEYIGRKILSTSTLRDIGQSVVDMFKELINLQNETQHRLALQPAELIESVDRVRVIAEGTVITISVRIITQARTVEEVLIPAAFDVTQFATGVLG